MDGVNLRMDIEPEERHRFRTLKEGSHGTINGDGESYPSAVLEVNTTGGECFDIKKIKVYCYVTASNTELDLILSPHTLKKKGVRKDDSESKTTFHLIEPEENTSQVYKYIVKDYWICKCKQEDISSVLVQQYEDYKTLGITQKLQEKSKQNKTKTKISKQNKEQEKQFKIDNVVYLAFSMVNELTQQWKTVFSKCILNLDPIHINMLCNTHVPVAGPETSDPLKIVLLVRDVEFNYSLEVREFDKDSMENKWADRVKSASETIKTNKALVYELPGHPNPENKESVNCLIRLKHGRSESNEVDIVYTNLNHSPLIKRPHHTNYESGNTSKRSRLETQEERMQGGHKVSDSMIDSTAKPRSMKRFEEAPHTPSDYIKTDTKEVVRQKENVFKYLRKLGQEVEKSAVKGEEEIWNAFINTDNSYIEAIGPTHCSLFHDAIQVSQFYSVDCVVGDLESEELFKRIRERLGTWRTLRGRTLLHTAFVFDKFDFLKTLLDMWPDAILVQDQYGNTPLHVALQSRRRDWVEELIENDDFYNRKEPSSLDRMTRLLRIYNQANLTVLHSAIKKNCLPLVEMLLQHCQLSRINACEIRVMGNGDSLMHLVENMRRGKNQDNDSVPIKNMILKYYPNADQYLNYAEYNAYGDFCGATSVSCDSESDDDSDSPAGEMANLSLTIPNDLSCILCN